MQMSSACFPPGFGETLSSDGNYAVHGVLHQSSARQAACDMSDTTPMGPTPDADHSGSVSLAWLMLNLLDSESPIPL